MKYLFSLGLALSFCLAATAQPTVLFTENFDAPLGPDSVTAGHVSSNTWWNDTSFLSTTGNQSYHVQGSVSGSQVYFDTDPFSTIGKPYVYLSFDHIAKIFPANEAQVLISIDNGTTWDTLGGNQYRGSSTTFRYLDYFNAAAYAYNGTSPWGLPPNNYNTPDSSWWRSESFALSGIASDTGAFTGYANVKLRFVVSFNFPAGTGGYSPGWFIDNIKVTGASCDFIAPSLSFLSAVSSNCEGHNTGTVQLSPSYNFEVKALDSMGVLNTGVDSVSLHYSINGGAFTGVKMPLQANGNYLYSLTGLNGGDSVRYYIEAVDNGCPAIARLPKQSNAYETFVVDSNIPAKCPSSACLNPMMVSTFPWIEDFEGNEWQEVSSGFPPMVIRGDMPVFPNGHFVVTPDSTQSFGWSLKSGSTPTAGTGPSHDAQPAAGANGKYLYTEFSGATGVKATTLVTPCINMSDSVAKALSFYYHMFGNDINKLRIDIDTGSNNGGYYNNYFSIIGQQQTSSSDAWKKALVDLSPFAGQVIRVRFTVITTNASNDKQDIAIDQIEIKDLTQRDLQTGQLITGLNTPCSSTTNIPLEVAVYNNGQATLDSLPMAYQLDNGTVQRDTLFNANLVTFDSLVFTFSPLLSFNSQQSHVLKVWGELSGDQNLTNDTTLFTINPRQNTITGPLYFQDFKSGSYPEWDTTGVWSEELYSNNDRYSGPYNQYTRSGEYIIASAEGARLESSCIDVSSMTSPKLSFGYSALDTEINVLIKPSGQNWQTLETVSATSGSFSPKMKTQFWGVDLTPYKASNFVLAFQVHRITNPGISAFAALDYVQISDDSAADIALTDVSKALSKMLQGTKVISNMWFEGGLVAPGAVSYSFHVSLHNLCKLTPDVTGSLSHTGFPGLPVRDQSFAINLSDSLEAGRYLVKAWLETAGDINPANDTIEMQAVVAPLVTPPYFQDFDQCQYDFRTASPLEQWEIKNPVNITAYSGSRAAVYNDFNGLRGNESLLPPVVQINKPLYGAELRFYHKYNFPNGGSGRVEIFNAGWHNITDRNPNIGVNFPASFTGTQNWQFSSYPLPEFTQTGTYALRFVAQTIDSTGNGWAIDDFEFYVPEQHSASPKPNIVLNKLIPVSGNNQLSFSLKNTGAAPMDEVTATLILNGAVQFTENFSFSTLMAGGTLSLSFSQPLVLNQQNNQVQIVTSLPNGESDELPSDDTLSFELNLLPFYNSTPQCADFEQSSILLNINNTTKALGDFWKWVSPTKNFISTAHSGSKAWVTADSTYGPLEDQYLYTPSYAMDARQCYRFSFWHAYNTEYNFDGGNIEFSTDGGDSWKLLGDYGDTTWYNTSFVQALDAVNPGFSGTSNGWKQAFTDLHSYNADTIQFRFRFASGATMHGEGWAIDDLCFETLPGTCEAVGTGETALDNHEIHLYPNPANDKLFLHFSSSVQSLSPVLELGIYSQNGQLVKSWSQFTSLNEDAGIDISQLPKGVYLLKSIGETNTKVHFARRFVKM